jgi:ketopantoate reductase
MLQDILRGAPTEIDAICGAVVQAGERHQIAAPANWACWKLVKAMVGYKGEPTIPSQIQEL